MHDIKAILLDFDGVTLDCCEFHYIALNKSLREICNYEISKNDHEIKYNGLPTKEKLKILISNNIVDNNDLQIIIDKKNQYTEEMINSKISFDQEKYDLFKYMKDHNFLIGCVSNAIRRTLDISLEKMGVIKFFDVIISNQDVVRNKPYPDPYIFAANKLNISKENIIVVEDSEIGYQSALAFGSKIWKVKNAKEVNIFGFESFLRGLKND